MAIKFPDKPKMPEGDDWSDKDAAQYKEKMNNYEQKIAMINMDEQAEHKSIMQFLRPS